MRKMNRRDAIEIVLGGAAGMAMRPAMRAVAQNACGPELKPAYNPHKAPLYWTIYEYCFLNGKGIPEDEWKKNIDWMDANLKDYGYKMVCTDGWFGGYTFNENGYRTRHNSTWTHDYKYWAGYLRERGMELGVYENPLWIHNEAAQRGATIRGTKIPLSKVIKLDEKPNRAGLWVQVDREGAEQYVRGGVDYLAEAGAKYLRVDYLSYFENGRDHWAGQLGVERPHWWYTTGLKWIYEQCMKHGILLSLVMPNAFNDAAVEQAYGQMMRIDQDAEKGGWAWFSEINRGTHFYGWPQWFSPFDGFVYWSRISGRHKMILDGDFLRMGTFANDEERKSCISLNLVAGGPVTIADRYDSIDGNLWLYQNREMLALNEDGFVGKPLSDDPVSKDSQTWFGQMTNGDWILGLFNREASVKPVNLAFEDLGIHGSYKVRDLWAHADLGTATRHATQLAPHACQVLRLSKV